MVGWHCRHGGPEFEQALGVSDGQGTLVCCSPWGGKESDITGHLNCIASLDFPGASIGKEYAHNTGDMGSILGFGRSSGGGNGNTLQYSCQRNPMDRGAWQATVLGVAKSWTQLSS